MPLPSLQDRRWIELYWRDFSQSSRRGLEGSLFLLLWKFFLYKGTIRNGRPASCKITFLVCCILPLRLTPYLYRDIATCLWWLDSLVLWDSRCLKSVCPGICCHPHSINTKDLALRSYSPGCYPILKQSVFLHEVTHQLRKTVNHK